MGSTITIRRQHSGCSTGLNISTRTSEVEVLNDINGELINMYQVVKHHLDEFARRFRRSLTSREIYNWLKITPEETLTDIQRAARFYYLQKLGFGGLVKSLRFGTATTVAPRSNLLRLEEDLSQAHYQIGQNLYLNIWNGTNALKDTIDPTRYFIVIRLIGARKVMVWNSH